jgi:hypothetical protein
MKPLNSADLQGRTTGEAEPEVLLSKGKADPPEAKTAGLIQISREPLVNALNQIAKCAQ